VRTAEGAAVNLEEREFGLEISYTQSSSSEIEWSVSSDKLEDAAGLRTSRSIGNTLMIELARGG
jgi:hypothetical protein